MGVEVHQCPAYCQLGPSPGKEILNAETSGLRGGGGAITFFYEDFANGFAGNNGFGALTVEDTSPDVTIWQYVAAEGDGFYQDATPSGVQPPAGEFSTNIGGLVSETAANGNIQHV